MSRKPAFAAAVVLAFAVSACAPKVGTREWCAKMQEKPKGDWSANEAGDFLKHCLLPGTEVGSSDWCAQMKEKPKGEWTGDEAGEFLKHCTVPASKEKPN